MGWHLWARSEGKLFLSGELLLASAREPSGLMALIHRQMVDLNGDGLTSFQFGRVHQIASILSDGEARGIRDFNWLGRIESRQNGAWSIQSKIGCDYRFRIRCVFVNQGSSIIVSERQV